MPYNVFVIGMDKFVQEQLEGLPRANEFRFHPLLRLDEVVHTDDYDIPGLLQQAEQTLDEFTGTVDAIVSAWDFPSSTLLPLLRQPRDLPGAALEAVLKCEHKYWSRCLQADIAPETVPAFELVNPFADDAVEATSLAFPFWIKPVKGHSSKLGFRINDAEEYRQVLQKIRNGIGAIGKPFNEILRRAETPDWLIDADGYTCIAEQIIPEAFQCTLEGYVFNGETRIYGIIDSIRHERFRSVFSRYQYPSQLPKNITDRMEEIARKLMAGIGYDNSPFNVEFYYEESNDKLWLLEINSRLSRSHTPLFELVDGASHLQVMVDVAIGLEPRLPEGEGSFRLAAKFMEREFEDKWVEAVPEAEDIERVKTEFPGSRVEIKARPGAKLSDLLHRDSYSYEIANLFLGADSQEELMKKERFCIDNLPFRFSPVSQT